MRQVGETSFARIVDRYCLNKAGGSREAWHIVLETEGAFPPFCPGDSIGVFPKNTEEEVQALLHYFHVQPGFLVSYKKQEVPAATWFREYVEIGSLSSALLEAIVAHASSIDRERLLPLSEEKSQRFLLKYTLSRFLQEHVPHGISLDCIAPLLMPLRPRLYSIASGPSLGKNRIELIVARVVYEREGFLKKGVCSNYLIDQVKLHDPVLKIFHQPTRHFIFPNDAQLIMVGSGTGIAPFRAYMQEVAARAMNTPACWLFFGERNSTADFFYEEFWKQQMGAGRLRLNVAFSCDQEHKVYVQHRMWEERDELWRWLAQGAHFFVCGHAAKMAKDVEHCLLDIAKDEGGMKSDQAEEWLVSMRQQKRYLKDVY